jgi:ABC-type cobalamin transport system permease subunit
MFEISSVPLSIVNYFRDHKEWSEKHAKLIVGCARVTFAVLFLTIRIFMGTPHGYLCIRGAYFAMTADVEMYWLLRGWIGLVWVGQLMLLALQMHWAWLIVKGLIKAFMAKGKILAQSSKNRRNIHTSNHVYHSQKDKQI